jgi:hypothetical protein
VPRVHKVLKVPRVASPWPCALSLIAPPSEQLAR